MPHFIGVSELAYMLLNDPEHFEDLAILRGTVYK